MQDLEKNLEINRRSVSSLSAFAIANYEAGNEEITNRLLEEILATDPATYASYEDVARVYVTLGDFESAFEWLERGYTARSRGMIFLKGQHSWDPIRNDERFQDLMGRMNMGAVEG